MLHRNSQKRYYVSGAIYSVTITTQNRWPYFREPIFCELLIENLKLAKQLKGFKLLAFNILFDHLHLLIQPDDQYNISKVMQFLKRHFSRDINYILSPEGAIRESRLRPGDYYYLAKVINQHDNKIKEYKNQFIEKYGQNQNHFPKFQWQKSFYDHIIRGTQDLTNHYHYTVYNFLKHKLPDDWLYTSLNYKDLIDEI